MINLLLVLLLVHFIVPLLTGKKSTVLGCGLLGFSGEYPVDTDKLAILFMYNETRGAHSSGYYNHNTAINPELRIIKKGGKVSENMLPNNAIKPNELFIGHTRHATSGTGYTLPINAHPFLFGKWVGVHNGTLKNLKGLRREYDFDEKIIDIDSKVFPASMDKNNNFKVLSHYEGAAALLWANTSIQKNPTLYAYHDKERPLFVGSIEVNGKKGMYLSSIEDSLEAIGCENVKELDIHKLYQIQNGMIVHELPISRAPKHIIKNEEKVLRLPNSLTRKCRAHKALSKMGGKSTEKFDDGTVIVRYDAYTARLKCLREEVVYDPAREMTVHVRYMSDGGFEEIKVSDAVGTATPKPVTSKDENGVEVNSMSLDDVLNYVSSVYSELDEIRAGLSNVLDSKGMDDKEVKPLDKLMLNVSNFVGSLAEMEEVD